MDPPSNFRASKPRISGFKTTNSQWDKFLTSNQKISSATFQNPNKIYRNKFTKQTGQALSQPLDT